MMQIVNLSKIKIMDYLRKYVKKNEVFIGLTIKVLGEFARFFWDVVR